MTKQLSQNAIKEFFSEFSADPFLQLITITHESFSPIRIVNNSENIISNGNEFVAFPFTIILPDDDGESVPVIKIVLDNVNLDFITELRTITSPANVKVEAVLASNPDYIEIDYDELSLNSVSVTAQKIVGSMTLDDLFSVNLTSETYGPSNFPGLFA